MKTRTCIWGLMSLLLAMGAVAPAMGQSNDDIDAEIARLKKMRELKRLQREVAAEDKRGARMDLPCYENSVDDDEYIRDRGIGKDKDEGEAIRLAMEDCKQKMRMKLEEQVVALTDNYSHTVKGNTVPQSTLRKSQSLFRGKVDGVLKRCRKTCEDVMLDEYGMIQAFYAMESPVDDFEKELMKAAKQAGLDEKAFRAAFDETFKNFPTKEEE
ncbi:MAG: hypothetical protein IJV22_05315 [Bacteroidales bacterium]|nr:hypothetical protein [Bacteroidales bacterium]